MLDNLDRIHIKDPVDIIISQIRDSIISGLIKPGEKLPPERKLADKLGVSRNQVREAINKLSFYGLVKVLPQSGTIVTGTGTIALEGLISDVLKIEDNDFQSLVETRILLEKEAARLAAINRTKEDMEIMAKALMNYERKLERNETAIEEDLHFHIKIAEAGKNNVLKSLMMVITPDIVKRFIDLKVCDDADNQMNIQEHREILKMISEKKPDCAVHAMEQHLSGLRDFKFGKRTLIN